MIQSMTGYGHCEQKIASAGKISVDIRSTNHKFLESVLHLPEGFLSFEDKVKKEIESRLKRGRVTCVVTITGAMSPDVRVNQTLLDRYLRIAASIRKQHRISGGISIDTLMTLPGVLVLEENRIPADRIWPALSSATAKALAALAAMRQKEGRALYKYLCDHISDVQEKLSQVSSRFDSVSKKKAALCKTELEQATFLKDADITEELDRLSYHTRNFRSKLGSGSPVGKELDFICQEMQREANTMGAKSCDGKVSADVVQIKSMIEKLREQVQNVE
jgi:uncharacterized protein (TIGR00255 family)